MKGINMRFSRLKKTFVFALAAVMGLSLMMTGCEKDSGDKAGDKEQETEAVDAVEVSSLEEFIDAIEPGANIVFKKGTYDFTPDLEELYGSDGKKFNKKHEYVQIIDCFDGVELVIQDVEGLTISGQEGKNIELQVEPRYADVIRFENCTDISLNNMTMGHTEDLGSCAGDVLEFAECENISLDDMDLYGCGTYAVNANDTSSISVTNSTLRDCSYGLVWISSCDDVTFKSCEMSGTSGFTMLEIYRSDVTFNKCTFEDNTCDSGFVTFLAENTIAFKACTFGAVESANVNFGDLDAGSTGITFDSKCTFDDSLPSAVGGASGSVTGVTIDGDIDTVGELLEAIEPYAYIELEDGYYDLTEYIDTLDVDGFNACHEYVQIESVFDGYQVVVYNCDGLSIGGQGDPEFVEIVTEPRYASVFQFNNCDDLYLYGMTMGHTETGDCVGSVIELLNCDYVEFDYVDLYGCGVYGLEAYQSGNVYMNDSRIHDCAFGPFFISELAGDYYFDGCTFDESDGQGYIAVSQYNTYFYSCLFGINETYEVLSNPCVSHDNCEFADMIYWPENAYGEATEGNYDKSSLDDLIHGVNAGDGIYAFSAFYYDGASGEYLLPFYRDEYDEYVYAHMILSDEGYGTIKGMTGNELLYFEYEEDGDELSVEFVDCPMGHDYTDANAKIEIYKEDFYFIIKLTMYDTEVWFMQK